MYRLAVAPVADGFSTLYEYVGSRVWNYRLFAILDAEFQWFASMTIQSLVEMPGSPLAGHNYHYFMFAPVLWTAASKGWQSFQAR